MKYDPQIHHRRSVRLPGYDYSQPGAYFVTICTYNRELSLQDQVKEAVRSVWLGLPARFPRVVLDEFVIMPNHLHGIIILAPTAASGTQGRSEQRPYVGRHYSGIQIYFSHPVKQDPEPIGPAFLAAQLL